MSRVLRSNDLRKMTPSQITKAVSSVRGSAGSRTTQAVRIQKLRTQVKGYERQYKMTSRQMIQKVCCGKLEESGEVDKWLNSYNLLSVYEKVV